jgi:DNA-binding transcriptional MerR regulator
MTTGTPAMRIGEVAERTGTTPRTIRYYEELGLLGGEAAREQGKHRLYSEADVERITEIVKLKGLLGLTLEQLADLIETVSARAEIRQEYFGTDDPERRRELLLQVRPLIERQLSLVVARREELTALEGELRDRLALVDRRLDELAELAAPAAAP